MTRGFRNQQPGRGGQGPGGRDEPDDLEASLEQESFEPSRRAPRLTRNPGEMNPLSSLEDKLDSLDKYSDEDTLIEPERADFGRRLVAALIDVFAAYLIGVVVSFIPFVNIFLRLELTMVLFLIVRDYFFQGRGIGKNLMGLQVVDIKTGRPASFVQSIKRNVVIFGPTLVLYSCTGVTKVLPLPWLSDFVKSTIELCGTIYTVIVVPYEAYRTYARADGRRLGDMLAGTAVVDSNMDFSQPVKRR